MTSIHAPQSLPEARPDSNVAWLDGRQGVVQLSWRTGLLEQIRSFVGSTYVSRSGKGSDVGGVFYGTRDGESIQVATWRPIPRGKDATSHFYLDSKDEQLFAKVLKAANSDSNLDGLELVGWFRSRTKGGLELDPQDLVFHEKFFESPSQFAMVIRPSHQRPAEAAVHMRNEQGELELDAPAASLSLQPGPVGVSSTDLGAAPIPGVALGESNSGRSKQFPITLVLSLFAIAAVVAVGAILMLQWNQTRVENLRGETLGLELVFDGSDLKARWNPASSAIANADTAQLQLGGEKLNLSHAELAQGFMRVPLKAGVVGDTEVSLRVGNREEVAQLVVAPR